MISRGLYYLRQLDLSHSLILTYISDNEDLILGEYWVSL